MNAENALIAITKIFYSDVTDRVAAHQIGRILSEAGFGPHARIPRLTTGNTDPRKGSAGSPLLPDTGQLQPNGNVWSDSQWWQAHRASDGQVYRCTGHGNWILPPKSVQDTFRPY